MLDSNSSSFASVPSASTLITLPAGLMTGRLVHKVAPVYPTWAASQSHRGNGGAPGLDLNDWTVKNLIPVSGPRELIEPSIGAVQQWRYRPYVVNGKSVEVTTDIQLDYESK